MLHVTNGDCAADPLRAAGLPGEVIAWRDVLHCGPTPAGLNLERMSDARARFLAGCGADDYDAIRREFAARDAALRDASEVTLWFEHDLYDQLQLIQILAALAEQQPATRAELIVIDRFAGVEPFHGLGQLDAAQLASLWPHRRRVGRIELELGARAWQAFCSPNPDALRRFVAGEDLRALPFLRAALERQLEEFPSAPDGLSRTERQILGAVADGHATLEEIFRATQRCEAAPFMGDTTLQWHIDALANARTPLLARDPITLTPAGWQVRTGEADHRTLNGLDRWLGGVHLVMRSR